MARAVDQSERYGYRVYRIKRFRANRKEQRSALNRVRSRKAHTFSRTAFISPMAVSVFCTSLSSASSTWSLRLLSSVCQLVEEGLPGLFLLGRRGALQSRTRKLNPEQSRSRLTPP